MGECYPSARFELGRLMATPGALRVLSEAGQTPAVFLARHVTGDWGDVCAEDARANDGAIAHESDPARRYRVLSAYRTSLGDRIWIITEHDRSATTILLPDEY